MRLVQKKFQFQNGEKVIPNQIETEGLKLVVNAINTDLSIEELFVDSKISAGYIKGWSLLALLEDSSEKGNFNSLELKDNKFELAFIAPSGNFYQIYAIIDPTLIYPPKDIEDTEIDRIIALLQSVLPETPPTPEIPDPENSPEESSTTEDAEAVEQDSDKLPLEEVVAAEVAEIPETNGISTEDKAADAEAEATKGESTDAGDSGKAEAEAASEEIERAQESEKYAETRFALERLG